MLLLQILGSQRISLHSRMPQTYISARSCTKGCEVDVPMRPPTDQYIYIHLPSESRKHIRIPSRNNLLSMNNPNLE
jgi:hypothetical protein